MKTNNYVSSSEANITFIETFFNFLDASVWVEKHLEEFDKEQWVLEQCSINYMNSAFRAGVVFSKRQKELF